MVRNRGAGGRSHDPVPYAGNLLSELSTATNVQWLYPCSRIHRYEGIPSGKRPEDLDMYPKISAWKPIWWLLYVSSR